MSYIHTADLETCLDTLLEVHLDLSLRKDANILCSRYDIVPTIAAPQSTSINTIAATPDCRWIFTGKSAKKNSKAFQNMSLKGTGEFSWILLFSCPQTAKLKHGVCPGHLLTTCVLGGSDGWIRKFNWVDTVNNKSLLTVAQRHPFVESVQKAALLQSYFENEETVGKFSGTQYTENGVPLSPVYSLAVQHQALWILSGTEGGAINLQSVRHDEGKRITILKEHSKAVSVLSLSKDETSLLSGSWDKKIHDWDLNTGTLKRSFFEEGSGSQISAIEIRPMSDMPVPRAFAEPQKPASDTFSSDNMNRRKSRGSIANGFPAPPSRRESAMSSGMSPGADLFGEDQEMFGDGDNARDDNMFGDDDNQDWSKGMIDNLDKDEIQEQNDAQVGPMSRVKGDEEEPSTKEADQQALPTPNGEFAITLLISNHARGRCWKF